MIRRKLRAFPKCERGTQMIEFAFLLPFLILLFAGAIEMGRMFYTYTTLQKSTGAGARYLSNVPVNSDGTFKTGPANLCGSTDADAARSLIVYGRLTGTATPIVSNLSCGNVQITGPGTSLGVRYVTVKVTYAYQPLAFDLGSMTGSSDLSLNFTFTPVITMRYMP
jgi:Flp pilus assembly protein TadG